MCVCVYKYVCSYIRVNPRERERERAGEKERERERSITPNPKSSGMAAAASFGMAAALADPESVAMLSSMGFDERQAVAALTATGGSLEGAADW